MGRHHIGTRETTVPFPCHSFTLSPEAASNILIGPKHGTVCEGLPSFGESEMDHLGTVSRGSSIAANSTSQAAIR